MKCPFCGAENIGGVDACEECCEDLSSIDGIVPKTKFEKVLMQDPLSKLKPREVVMISPKETVLSAVKKMNAGKFGCLLVSSKKDSADGILTERDILYKVAARKKQPGKILVGEIMTPSPTTLDESDTLTYALNQMAVGGYRHIPILRNGKPVGIISVRDILKYLSKLFPS